VNQGKPHGLPFLCAFQTWLPHIQLGVNGCKCARPACFGFALSVAPTRISRTPNPSREPPSRFMQVGLIRNTFPRHPQQYQKRIEAQKRQSGEIHSTSPAKCSSKPVTIPHHQNSVLLPPKTPTRLSHPQANPA